MARYQISRETVLFTIVAFLLCSCGESGGDGGEGINVADLVPVSLVEQYRIGSVEDPIEGFSRISDVVVAPDGTALVLEGVAAEVRVYDSVGQLERSFGGKGSGPGELQRPNSLGRVDDTIWVSDPGNNRVTLYTLDGELAGTVPQRRMGVASTTVGASSMRVSVFPEAYLGEGRFGSSFQIAVVGASASGQDSVPVPSVVFDMRGTVVDTVGWDMHVMSTGFLARDGSILVLRNPFKDEPLHSEIDGHRVTVERPVASAEDRGVFAVNRVDSVGDTIFSQAFEYRPRRVTGAFLDSLVESHLDRLPESSDRSEWESAVREALPKFEFHPPVTEHRIGEDGSIWLLLDREEEEVASWVVLCPDGSPLGLVSLPIHASIRWSEDGHLWTVEEDELEVPWLVRYRLSGFGS